MQTSASPFAPQIVCVAKGSCLTKQPLGDVQVKGDDYMDGENNMEVGTDLR